MAGPRPVDPDSPDALARDAAEGSRDAFARIIRLHHEALTRLALLVTADTDRAAEAVVAALPAAWQGLRSGSPGPDLAAWLAGIVVDEARFVARQDLPPVSSPLPPATCVAPNDPPLAAVLAGLTAADRALLALYHLAGRPPEAGARSPLAAVRRWQVRRLRRRLDRLSRAVADAGAGSRAGALRPGEVDGRARDRLAAAVDVPVRPIDADAAARRAIAELSLERRRRVSVLVSAVVGFVVAAAPYLVPLVYGR